jgi:hypothetical protein
MRDGAFYAPCHGCDDYPHILHVDYRDEETDAHGDRHWRTRRLCEGGRGHMTSEWDLTGSPLGLAIALAIRDVCPRCADKLATALTPQTQTRETQE